MLEGGKPLLLDNLADGVSKSASGVQVGAAAVLMLMLAKWFHLSESAAGDRSYSQASRQTYPIFRQKTVWRSVWEWAMSNTVTRLDELSEFATVNPLAWTLL
jgi:hypothetical protein